MKMRNIFGKAHDVNIWKGAVSGLIAGLTASIVMNKFQAIASDISKFHQKESGQDQEENSNSGQKDQQQSEPATVKTAEAVSKDIFKHELSNEGKQMAGPYVHYIFGSTMGGIYGLLSEVKPEVTLLEGLAFGTTLWFAADEVGVPLFKLSEPPAKVPLSIHAYALASHWVYGMAAELVRKVVRKAI
jgi:putative membrane protein